MVGRRAIERRRYGAQAVRHATGPRRAADRAAAHGPLSRRRGLAGRSSRRGAGHRRPDRRGPLRAGRGDLRRRPAPVRARPARRPAAGDRLAARRDPPRHLPGARGPAPMRRRCRDERARERDAAGARVVRPLRPGRARRRGRGRPPHHGGADGQGGVDRGPGGDAQRRQPAEGRARQVAGAAAARHRLRRADARGRCGRQGRDPPIDTQPRRRGRRRGDDQQRHGRDRRGKRPRRGDARRAHHRDPARADCTPESIMQLAVA